MTVAVFPFSSFLFKTWSIKWKRQSLSRVRLFGIPWAVVCQDPLSMEFSRQEYWSGVPFPSPGDLPDPGIKSWSPAYEGGFFTFWATREAQRLEYNCFQYCVSTVQQSESAIHIPLSSLSRISSPPSHLQAHQTVSRQSWVFHFENLYQLLWRMHTTAYKIGNEGPPWRGPLAKTPCFQCSGHGLDPWLRS